MADRGGSARTRAAATLLVSSLAIGLVACSATPSAAPLPTPTTALPTVAPTASPTATAALPTLASTLAPTSGTATRACGAVDLKASHDLVEGAAGSRLTNVVLTAATTCWVDLYPALGIRDGTGTQLVGSTATGSGRIELHPDVTYSTEVRFANWCDPDPRFPLALVIRIGPEEVAVTGSSFPDVGDMPPCNGVGGPRLESNPWTAAP